MSVVALITKLSSDPPGIVPSRTRCVSKLGEICTLRLLMGGVIVEPFPNISSSTTTHGRTARSAANERGGGHTRRHRRAWGLTRV